MLNYLFTLVFPSLSSLFSLLASRHLPSPVICRAFHMMKSVSTFCTHSSADSNFSSAVESEVLGFAGFFHCTKIKWWYFWAPTRHTTHLINIFDVWRRFFHSHSNSSSFAHMWFSHDLFSLARALLIFLKCENINCCFEIHLIDRFLIFTRWFTCSLCERLQKVAGIKWWAKPMMIPRSVIN